MGIFTRFKDIVASNINSMLDHAEDPEKLIKLMIQEMEDTLVELKANCAGAMADAKKINRELEMVQHKADEWEAKAELALRKGWPSMFRGYLNEEARYQKSFAGNWYLTGDLARRDADGYFWFVGRADDLISAGDLRQAQKEKRLRN